MSKSNRGTVTPNIKRCIDDMLSVFDDNDKDVADVVVDTLLNYLLKSHAKSYWKKDLLEYEKKDQRRSRVKKRKYK